MFGSWPWWPLCRGGVTGQQAKPTLMSTPAKLSPDTRPLMRRRPASSTGGESTTAATTTTNPGSVITPRRECPNRHAFWRSARYFRRSALEPKMAAREGGSPSSTRRKTDTEPVGQLALAAQASVAKELAGRDTPFLAAWLSGSRQVRNPSERRGAWSYRHWHADPFYRHAGEQGGSSGGGSDEPPRPPG